MSISSFGSLYHRGARRLRHQLEEAGVSDEEIMNSTKAGEELLAEARMKARLATEKLVLHSPVAGRYEVYEADALFNKDRKLFWGSLAEIGEWLDQSAAREKQIPFDHFIGSMI